MRDSERIYAVMFGLGLYDLDTAETDEDSELEVPAGSEVYGVSGGGDFEVPLVGPTQLRLVLARWIAGEYPLDQVRVWLQEAEVAEALREELNDEPSMTEHAEPLVTAPDETLRPWLLRYLQEHDWEGWDEERQNEALSSLRAYLPEWVTYGVTEVGWSGGDGGSLVIREGRSVAELQTHIEQAVLASLHDLEPQWPGGAR